MQYKEFPTSLSTFPIRPLVTANAPLYIVFCTFHLRSVTDEQHVRSHAQEELAAEIFSDVGRH